MTDEKTMLSRYLQAGRDALLWKLEGLTERQARTPMTPTGTNLLGLVKHVASMEFGYFGEVFGRETEDLPWLAAGAEANADMWAAPEESLSWVESFYRRAWAASDHTIAELDLDSSGRVPWWHEPDVTLRRVMVHLIDETARHAGHADIVRELIDGAAGLRRTNSNLPEGDSSWWADYRARLQAVADGFPE